jgi:ribose transport system permease protein
MATTALPQKASSTSTLEAVFSLLARTWSFLFLLGLIIFFSSQAPGFFTIRNFSSVLVTATLVTLMALGQTYVIITAGIDLSIGWTVGLASVIAARTMRDLVNGGMSVPPAIFIGIIAALLVALIPGLINGILVARVKVPPFIATLGMFGIVRGVAFLLTDGQQVVGNLPANLREVLRGIGSGSLIYNLPGQGWFFLQEPAGIPQTQLRDLQSWLPYPVLVTVIVLFIFGFILGRTQFGRHTYAIGGNKDAALRAGINLERHLIIIYLISAFCAGIAGVMHVFRFTAGAPQAGEAALLDSVAAVVIGGTSLFGGEGRVRGAVVGALIFGVLSTGLVMLNIPSLWQFVIVGIVIIIAVLVNQAQALLERRRSHV